MTAIARGAPVGGMAAVPHGSGQGGIAPIVQGPATRGCSGRGSISSLRLVMIIGPINRPNQLVPGPPSSRHSRGASDKRTDYGQFVALPRVAAPLDGFMPAAAHLAVSKHNLHLTLRPQTQSILPYPGCGVSAREGLQ